MTYFFQLGTISCSPIQVWTHHYAKLLVYLSALYMKHGIYANHNFKFLIWLTLFAFTWNFPQLLSKEKINKMIMSVEMLYCLSLQWDRLYNILGYSSLVAQEWELQLTNVFSWTKKKIIKNKNKNLCSSKVMVT